MRGPVQREFDLLARRYAAGARSAVAISCGALGLTLVPAGLLASTASVVALLALWSAGYPLLVAHRPGAWPVALDSLLIGWIALTQARSVPPASRVDDTGWILALVSVTAVSYQWHTPRPAGALAALFVVGAYIAGTWGPAGGRGGAWVVTALWVLVEAALSRSLRALLDRAGRHADGKLADREEARRAAAVSSARRTQEREYLATLHDTAASTFLMIGAGAIPQGGQWIAEQARRDLAVLQGAALGPGAADRRDPGASVEDLGPLLEELVRRSGHRWQRSSTAPVPVPHQVADAVTGGVREALHNVVRHARGADATVRLSAEGPVVVEVTDDGPGFDVERIGAHSRGITQSLQARMSRVGGRATVTSSPGNGTSVRLEWPGPGSRGAGLPGAGCGGVGTPEAESIGG